MQCKLRDLRGPEHRSDPSDRDADRRAEHAMLHGQKRVRPRITTVSAQYKAADSLQKNHDKKKKRQSAPVPPPAPVHRTEGIRRSNRSTRGKRKMAEEFDTSDRDFEEEFLSDDEDEQDEMVREDHVDMMDRHGKHPAHAGAAASCGATTMPNPNRRKSYRADSLPGIKTEMTQAEAPTVMDDESWKMPILPIEPIEIGRSHDWIGADQISMVDRPLHSMRAGDHAGGSSRDTGYSSISAVDWPYSTSSGSTDSHDSRGSSGGSSGTPESPAASIPLSPGSAPAHIGELDMFGLWRQSVLCCMVFFYCLDLAWCVHATANTMAFDQEMISMSTFEHSKFDGATVYDYSAHLEGGSHQHYSPSPSPLNPTPEINTDCSSSTAAAEMQAAVSEMSRQLGATAGAL